MRVSRLSLEIWYVCGFLVFVGGTEVRDLFFLVTVERSGGSMWFVFSFFGEDLLSFARFDVDCGCFNGVRDFA